MSTSAQSVLLDSQLPGCCSAMTNFVGAVVRLSLAEGQFEGTVVSLDTKSKKITLEKVTNCETGERLYGLQRYYGREVKQVSVVKKSREHLPIEEKILDSEAIDSSHFTYISRLNEKFYEIIDGLREESKIGMEVISIDADERCICIVEVSCKSKVFLFDIIQLGVYCIKQYLADIVESNQITKVFHDCRNASSMFFHQCGITLCNVFDTQVTDLFIRRNATREIPTKSRSLCQCLVDYLHLGDEELRLVDEFSQTDTSVWLKRPLPQRLLCSAAKHVEYLPSLADVMHERYMQDLKRGFDVYLNIDRFPDKPRPHSGNNIIPELTAVLHSKPALVENPLIMRHSNGVAARAECEVEDIVSDRERLEEEKAMRTRKEHEAKWIKETTLFKALTPSAPTMSKRQETLYKHLERLLCDHEAEVRMDQERSLIDRQADDKASSEEQEEIEYNNVDVTDSNVNPPYLYDSWSANPQFDREVQYPIYLHGKRNEVDIVNQDESPEPLVGWTWPTDRQLHRMTRRKDGHKL